MTRALELPSNVVVVVALSDLDICISSVTLEGH